MRLLTSGGYMALAAAVLYLGLDRRRRKGGWSAAAQALTGAGIALAAMAVMWLFATLAAGVARKRADL